MREHRAKIQDADWVYLPSANCPECSERAVFAGVAPGEPPILLCIDCRLLGRLIDLDGEGG